MRLQHSQRCFPPSSLLSCRQPATPCSSQRGHPRFFPRLALRHVPGTSAAPIAARPIRFRRVFSPVAPPPDNLRRPATHSPNAGGLFPSGTPPQALADPPHQEGGTFSPQGGRGGETWSPCCADQTISASSAAFLAPARATRPS